MRFKKYFYTFFIIGIIVRLALSYHMGNHDMVAYYDWGNNVLQKGLLNSYYGVYFPIQYQFFSLYALIAQAFHVVRWMIVFKVFNLFFEIGVFVLLTKLLEKFKVSRAYALIYWFHPWFLLNFSQGFIDSQFSFFILLSILLFYKTDTKKVLGYIVSGVPFAVAFLLKPQILMLFFALFVFFLLNSFKKKIWKNMMFFVPSTIFFVIYSLYFGISSYLSPITGNIFFGSTNGFLILAKSYLDIINVMPCLTCSMPNFWYPIAHFMTTPGRPIYTITSRIFILPNLTVEKLALIVVVLIIISFCFVLLNLKKHHGAEKILRLLLFVSLLVPFLMTNAHANHPYLGTVLLIPLMAKYRNIFFRIASNLLLLALVVFLYVSYGFGMNYGPIPYFIGEIPKWYVSIFSIIGFSYVLFYLFKISLNENKFIKKHER